MTAQKHMTRVPCVQHDTAEEDYLMAGVELGCTNAICSRRHGAEVGNDLHAHVVVSCEDGFGWIPFPFQSRQGLAKLLEILRRPAHAIFNDPGVTEAILARPELETLHADMSEEEAARFRRLEEAGGEIRYDFSSGR